MKLFKFNNSDFNFIGRRKIWFIISALIILSGVVGYIFHGGFNLGIDFSGGNLIEIQFKKDIDNVSEVREVLSDIGFGNVILQRTATDRFIIRTTPIDNNTKQEILNYLDKNIGIIKPPIQDRSVSPSFGRQITRYALIAIGISVVGILLYIWIRFEFRFGVVAIATLAHDVLVTLGVYALLSREINVSTIAALLTILGYSLNDTIVVFDRIRENTAKARKTGYAKTVNSSVNMTLGRSINTSVTTLFPIIALLVIGSAALQDFALALMVGIISGTYSSIFFASPILVGWNNKFPKYKK